MAPDPYKRVVSGILDAFERIAYVAIALALSVPIVMLVFSAALSMLEVSEVGVLETSLTVLDRVLLAFIFVELIDTVRVTVRERGIFIAEPFYWLGSSPWCDVSYCLPLKSNEQARKSSKTCSSSLG